MSEKNSRLEHFPISWFATVMGLSGAAMAWRKAAHVLDVPHAVGDALAAVTAITFCVIAMVYLVKSLRYPQAVVDEFRHPVRLSFFPTISISLILLSIISLEPMPALSLILWGLGATLQLGLTLYVMSAWIHHETFQIQHTNPAWFIPIVGNVLVPIAGVHHAPAEVSWFFFSNGMFFWLALFAIIFNRMIFHGMLPKRLLPTLFILIAPPAVAFIAYHHLSGDMDVFARTLFYVALFIALLLAVQVRVFLNLEFFLSWWACSFPFAALTVATLILYQTTAFDFFRVLAWALLVLVSFLIVGLVIKTGIAVKDRRICVPED